MPFFMRASTVAYLLLVEQECFLEQEPSKSCDFTLEEDGGAPKRGRGVQQHATYL